MASTTDILAQCDQAFEDRYQRSASDPHNAEMLSVWRDAWNASRLQQGDAEMRADAQRYRWLSRKVGAHGVIDGWAFSFPTHLSLPAPALALRDPEAALDQAIDAARQSSAGGEGHSS